MNADGYVVESAQIYASHPMPRVEIERKNSRYAFVIPVPTTQVMRSARSLTLLLGAATRGRRGRASHMCRS